MRLRLALFATAISFTAYGITWINGPWLPRFSYDPLNYWFTGLAALSVPVSLLAVGACSKRMWPGALTILAAIIIAVPLVPFGAIAIYESSNTKDEQHLSHQLLAERVAYGHLYRLYRTDCGATCSFGLELRREIEVLRYLKLVKPIWSRYQEDTATLQSSPNGELQVVRGLNILHTVKN